jgi:hypothetical protein
MKTIIAIAYISIGGFLWCPYNLCKAQISNTNSQPDLTAAPIISDDPVVAKGKDFEIRQSELDELIAGIKATATAEDKTITPQAMLQIKKKMLTRMIEIQCLIQMATEADKSNAVQKADVTLKALLDKAGSLEALNHKLKSMGMTQDALRKKIIKNTTAEATLARELGGTVTETEAVNYLEKLKKTEDVQILDADLK